MLRASLAMASFVLAFVASPALAATVAPATGLFIYFGIVAGQVLRGLPESGALLVWGTGLALASRAVARSGHR